MYEKLIEIIKKRFSDSDEDLADLEIVMDSLKGLDEVDTLRTQLDTLRLESEAQRSELDKAWRKRYYDRFFDNTESIEDILLTGEDPTPEETEEVYTIDDYINELNEEEKEKNKNA